MDTTLRVYLWAPKPYGNFMKFKEFNLPHKPLTLNASVQNEDELQIIFSSRIGRQIDDHVPVATTACVLS